MYHRHKFGLIAVRATEFQFAFKCIRPRSGAVFSDVVLAQSFWVSAGEVIVSVVVGCHCNVNLSIFVLKIIQHSDGSIEGGFIAVITSNGMSIGAVAVIESVGTVAEDCKVLDGDD